MNNTSPSTIETPAPNTVAANVNAAMLNAGHNSFSLCRVAGLPRTTFLRRLAGTGTDFTMPELWKLGKALKVAPSAFFGPESAPLDASEPAITVDGAEWVDEVTYFAQSSFDDENVKVNLYTGAPGKPLVADICFDGYIDGMKSAEYREMADRFEAFPAWLRAFADTVDGFTESGI